MSKWGKIAVRLDSFLNTITGLGDATRNKLVGMQQTYDPVLDVSFLESLFRSSDLAWRIVSSLPSEAMKDGFGLTTPAGDEAPEDVAQQAQEVIDAAECMGLSDKALEAACWGRGYGFGAIVLGIVGAGKPEEPYDDENVNGRLSWMMVTDRRWMQAATYYNDPESDRFGEVEKYRITPASTQANMESFIIHETRVERFPGVLTSLRERQQNAGCDYSVMQRIEPVLEQTTQNWEAVCQLMADMSQGVFSVDGLIDMLATGNEAGLLTRMRVLDMTRSVGRAIVLDSKSEKFERVRTPMDGVNDAILRTWERLAAAAEMPLTVLMGVSPAGLNATGASDVRMWYDKITRTREQVMGPRLLRILKLISRDLGHTDYDAWRITWPSLWKMTAPEQADLYLKVAQADKIYLEAQVVKPAEVALGRFANGDEFNAGKLQIEAEPRKEELKAKPAVAAPGSDEVGTAPTPGVDSTVSTPITAEATGTGTAVGTVQLTPSDVGIIVTVNEARASQGLPPWPDEDGKLSIAAFKAKHEVIVSAAASAEAGQTGGKPAPAPSAPAIPDQK